MIIISRIITALMLGLIGYQIGDTAGVVNIFPSNTDRALRFGALILTGAITGLVVGGLLGQILERFLAKVRISLNERTGGELVIGALGLVIGLVVSLLISLPILRLKLIGIYVLLPVTLIITYVFTEIATSKHAEILRLVGIKTEGVGGAQGKLLDSSALIDGRIDDLVASGFVEGELIVPVFVLEELQKVADSADDLRRARGRRGLDVVQKLRKGRLVSTPGEDWPELDGVDAKLVRMGSIGALAIVTTDHNLEKVARIQGVKVLNVNQLANALKPEFVTGEHVKLRVIKEGKEPGQGVGYLDDGTMVVIEKGATVVGIMSEVEVTSVIQSASGKLVFAKLVKGAAS
ncbi:MAG: hypothetical protein H7123_09545 [Thermoleophilia bacterium]|nr:hypothetical protein [Thermoleophilia bacterium]